MANRENCTFEFNLTRDRIEKDIRRELDGEQVSLLQRVELEPPCKVSECFCLSLFSFQADNVNVLPLRLPVLYHMALKTRIITGRWVIL